MPSNALKISQLVAMLAGIRDTHGDLDVILGLAGNPAIAIDGSNISVQGELPGQSLPAPCVVIGRYVDERGRMHSMPGQKYEASGTEDGWSANRGDAPEMTPLRFWTRYEGEKMGFRSGEKFFLSDGLSRPLEYAPAGIIRWREP